LAIFGLFQEGKDSPLEAGRGKEFLACESEKMVTAEAVKR